MLDNVFNSTGIVGGSITEQPTAQAQAPAQAPAAQAPAAQAPAAQAAPVQAAPVQAAPVQAAQAPDWREQIDPDHRQKMERFRSINDLGKAYTELEKTMSSTKRIPATVDSPQALQDLQNATRPASKEEYIRPEGMSDDQWGVATEAMFKAGIHKDQAAVFLHDMLGSGDKVRNQMVEAHKRFLFDTLGPTRTLQELQDVAALVKEATGNEALAKAIQDFKVAPEVTQAFIALKNILQPGTLATLQRNNAITRDPNYNKTTSELEQEVEVLLSQGAREKDPAVKSSIRDKIFSINAILANRGARNAAH